MEAMLLLSPPIPVIVKDAARAVKRVASLAVRVVTEETLNEPLGLPGMQVTRFAVEQQCEQLQAVLQSAPRIAPCDGAWEKD